MCKKIISIIALVLLIKYGFSQDNKYGYYSTKHFGPSALPVPDIHDGRVLKDMRIELYNDLFMGYSNDKATVPSIKVVVPLFSERVNFTAWMGVYEFYETNAEKLDEMHTDNPNALEGCTAGDVYISTDIQLLRQLSKWYIPDIVFRAAFKTASGGPHSERRYFDSPGYFFDASIAKSLYFKGSFFKELRFVVSGGFLCWQVGADSQNDAIMYGTKAILRSDYVSTSVEFGGYSGWIKNGDQPQKIKASIYGHVRNFDIFVQYQYGLQDYPYHLLRIGIAYNFSLSKKIH